MEADTWIFRVEPHPKESLGHFLGRFRRANHLSHRAIADHLGVRVKWVEDWEIASKRRNPTALQRVALSKLVEVEPKQLAKMLPPARLYLQTRLCAACYAESPVHQVVWQRAGKTVCDRHKVHLLSGCPVCQQGFRIPALWDDEHCEGCGLAFGQMQSYQKPTRKCRQSLTIAAPPGDLDRC